MAQSKLISDEAMAEVAAYAKERDDRAGRLYDAERALQAFQDTEGWARLMVMDKHIGVTMGRDNKTVYLTRREVDALVRGLRAARAAQDNREGE